jgi:hypothetical protein
MASWEIPELNGHLNGLVDRKILSETIYAK